MTPPTAEQGIVEAKTNPACVGENHSVLEVSYQPVWIPDTCLKA